MRAPERRLCAAIYGLCVRDQTLKSPVRWTTRKALRRAIPLARGSRSTTILKSLPGQRWRSGATGIGCCCSRQWSRSQSPRQHPVWCFDRAQEQKVPSRAPIISRASISIQRRTAAKARVEVELSAGNPRLLLAGCIRRNPVKAGLGGRCRDGRPGRVGFSGN
jgi:hypothetical protein